MRLRDGFDTFTCPECEARVADTDLQALLPVELARQFSAMARPAAEQDTSADGVQLLGWHARP